jgi:hypothetical protein
MAWSFGLPRASSIAVATACHNFLKHGRREIEIGIAGRNERHQRFALLAAEVRE